MPLLLAIRNPLEIVLNPSGQEVPLQSYLDSATGVCTFLTESGLILSSGRIHNLEDFIFCIEVGLDSNARKNRSGLLMEAHLEHIFKQAGLNFKTQVSTKEFEDLHRNFGKDIKKFDFVVFHLS
ncbi:hypothetical protein HSHS1_17980 [Helicobacter suis HS1]|nr:hypothetical protein HSHS1_17980 [Helicobacter suis HS1]